MREKTYSLKKYLKIIEDKYGGDIKFLPPVDTESVSRVEKIITWNFPQILKFFYSQETNGLRIGNKIILSLFDPTERKTWVENIERANDKKICLWFKNYPAIYDDYLVIAEDVGKIFCLSKKYDNDDPEIYLCEDYNSQSGVNLYNTGQNLEKLIRFFVESSF